VKLDLTITGKKNPEKHDKQKEIFSQFIDFAKQIKKPLVIHSWDAESECFEMVKGLDIPVVFHCFSGKRALANEIISEGFYISLSTMVLFSKNIRKVAKDVPLKQMLLETDSPFLSPEKDKDTRNYPWNIRISAAKIAKIKNIQTEDVLHNAEKNAVNIFNLKIV